MKQKTNKNKTRNRVNRAVTNRPATNKPIIGESRAQATKIINKINSLKPTIQRQQISIPMRTFLKQLIYTEQQKCPVPMQAGKLHYGVVRFQNTIQANLQGHCAIMGDIGALASYSNLSVASPILYATTGYDPAVTTNNTTGGWNLGIIDNNGMGFSPTEFERCSIVNAHVTLSITGVSNLNKKGTIHMFEDLSQLAYYGDSVDTIQNDKLLNGYDVNSLPKCTHYRKYDLVNLDSQGRLRYSYIPTSLYAQPRILTLNNLSGSGAIASPLCQTFGIIGQGMDPGTIIRVEYEVFFSTDVANDFINKYPVEYTSCYLNPDPYLLYLRSNTKFILGKDDREHKQLYMTISNNLLRRDPGSWDSMSSIKSDDTSKYLPSEELWGY